jgi:hypothetical protein
MGLGHASLFDIQVPYVFNICSPRVEWPVTPTGFFHSGCFYNAVLWIATCTVSTTNHQQKPAADTKTAFPAKSAGRRRVKDLNPTSSILKK